MLRLLDALAEETPAERDTRITAIVNSSSERVDSGAQSASATGLISAEARTSILEDLLDRARVASDSEAPIRAARDLARNLVSQMSGAVGKPRLALHVLDGSTRAAAVLNVLPDAAIVHLVRDGRAVALMESRASSIPTGLRPWARAWLSEMGPLLRYEADHPRRVLKLAYEDLLMAPASTFDRLCAWLAIDPQADVLAAAFGSVLGDLDRFAFRSDALDPWQTLELESELQPLLSLLGYRPAADLGELTRMRAAAERSEAVLDELSALKARLAMDDTGADRSGAANTPARRPDRAQATAGDLETLQREAYLYRETLEELRELRVRMQDQQNLPADIATLRWKAKRYDQLRAAASPILRIRRATRR